ncbi:Calcineurin-like phosphoesterase [Micromonospora coriariae]|uniref:Calcineurin-like phosphoesterase n=1 Tax=Micromonospora coriariae TaxID=285665 RepID=A0A1C4X838_9ACTN|nr:metallophosphoesterase [Micromonospora coriariae]SCF04535.1 Calcineurin-like phosphoesterase [Micromonospora coriariae]
MTVDRTPLFVVADVHGHRAEMRNALHDAGLTDGAGHWSGADARLWLLGDYVDRGPDGIGVIDDVRQLTVQAAAAGGQVQALLGNHEVQLLAAYLFGTSTVPGWLQEDGFRGGWARFGGRDDDLRRLGDEHISWIVSRPAMAVVDNYLLVHSDTTRYLEFGDSVAAVNAGIAEALARRDAPGWLAFCGQISDRGAFRDSEPAKPDDPVATMLGTYGGEVLVHGHSTLTKHFGVAPGEVREALRYADGRVLAIDGGVYEGGRVLVTRLDGG